MRITRRPWLLALSLALAACTASEPMHRAPEAQTAAPPAAEIKPAESETPAKDAEAPPPAGFADWLEALRTEARAKGISDKIVTAALSNIKPIPRVLELDRAQPEFKLTFAQYMDRVVSSARVAKGKERMAQHRDLLARVAKTYRVPAQYFVALWGIETDFGRITGGFPVVPALATLAFDGRRSAYFRGELMNALAILDQGHILPEKMIGSWAGAMGQCQFMPSSFLRYAIDFDGDGRRDIWTDVDDVLGSAANYLSQSGWNPDQTWGRAVRLPAGFDSASLVGLDKKKRLSEWAALGVLSENGKALPKRDLEASLLLPDGPQGPAFLVYDNFRVFLKWNRSNFFALAAGHLADRLASH